MPRISSQTAEGLEAKELTTSAFRLGRHKEGLIDLSPCQNDIHNILLFRAREAARRQEQEDRMPTETDQAAAEIAVLLQEGENLNDFTPQQIGQIYFILRETQTSKEYFDWVVEGIRHPKERDRLIKKEKEFLRRTITDFERRLVGRDYGGGEDAVRRVFYRAWYGRERPAARELLVLENLIKKHNGNIEKAAADFAGKEIVRVLEQKGEEIASERIKVAKESIDPTEKKFGRAAERIPQLVEEGMKKRREIAGWTTAEELRRFIGRDITEADLSDQEIILLIIENNPDLLSRTRYRSLEGLKKGLVGKDDQELKRIANRIIKGLVNEHSFNTIVDTAVYIIDQKLPEAEIVEAAPVVKPELTVEAGKQVGEGEIALMIAEGLSNQEMKAKGVDPEAIKNVRRKYFYKDAAGQYKLKKVEDQAAVDQEKKDRLTEIQQRHQAEMEDQIDELTETTAIEDWKKLQRGQLVESYEEEVWRIYTNYFKGLKGIPQYNNENTGVPRILADDDLREKIQQFWIDEKTREYRSDPSWRRKGETKERAWQSLITKKPEIGEEYDYMVTKITAQELSQLGPETIAVLKGRGELSQSSYRQVEPILRTAMPDIIDQNGNLKSKEEIAKELAKKRIKAIFWALLVTLGIIDLEGAIASLYGEGKTTEADEVTKLLTGT